MVTSKKPGYENHPGTKNLIPIKKGQTDIPTLGGQAKSLAKTRANRLKGILAHKKLTPEQAYFYSLMKDKEYGSIIDELITLNLNEGWKDDKRRDAIISQLQQFMPKVNVNMNFNNNELIKTIFEVLNNNDAYRPAINEIQDALERIGGKTS